MAAHADSIPLSTVQSKQKSERRFTMEQYIEVLVRKKPNPLLLPGKILLLFLDILLLLLSFRSAVFLPLLLLSGALTYLCFLYSHVEYEYLYFEGELSVDRILNKSKRRKVCEIRKSEFRLLAAMDSEEMQRAMGGQCEIRDYSDDGFLPGKPPKLGYLYEREGKKLCLVLTVSDRLQQAVRRTAPEKVSC